MTSAVVSVDEALTAMKSVTGGLVVDNTLLKLEVDKLRMLLAERDEKIAGLVAQLGSNQLAMNEMHRELQQRKQRYPARKKTTEKE